MQRRTFLILTLLVAACRSEEPIPTTTAGLGRHEVRLEDLPPPYATKSASNPPLVMPRPKNAVFQIPAGYQVSLFADDLENPRNMVEGPNGDIIVAEMAAGRISILRDENKDGRAELRYTFAENLEDPYGLAVRGPWLYVTTVNAILQYPYLGGQREAINPPKELRKLPGHKYHRTRNLLFNNSGTRMYVTIGSASDIEREPPPHASIVQYEPDGQNPVLVASGMRNPVGLAWEPATGALWATVNERDGLGDELVPDYVTRMKLGDFFGWPYAYLGPNEDPRRKGERPDLVRETVIPSLLLPAHSAPLGIVFYTGSMFPKDVHGDAFVALHGSWNRSKLTGYKVIRIPFEEGTPTGGFEDFLSGFVIDANEGEVWGRPAGLLVLRDGSMLVADDGGNVIWRITYKKP